MPQLPASFLVRATFPVERVPKWPKKLSLCTARDLTPIPPLHSLDRTTAIFELRAGWHERGLLLSIAVAGKTVPPQGFADAQSDSDSVTVSIDTRDTKSIRRGGRFCQRFRVLPHGGDSDHGAAIVQEPVPRSREGAPFHNLKADAISKHDASGYEVLARIAAANLNGFDPVNSPRLGFFVEIHDLELGRVPLTGDHLLPTEADPSLWSTLELVET